jgi:uncharacterized protein YjbI with pentapeptide repeats
MTGVENLMANASHLSLLKKGAQACNEWRDEYLLDRANMSGADLSGADLNEANLSGADLSGAKLFSVVLDGVNFERATVGYTIFGRIDLSICSGLDSVKHFAP